MTRWNKKSEIERTTNFYKCNDIKNEQYKKIIPKLIDDKIKNTDKSLEVNKNIYQKVIHNNKCYLLFNKLNHYLYLKIRLLYIIKNIIYNNFNYKITQKTNFLY
jgi:hypothetical protein